MVLKLATPKTKPKSTTYWFDRLTKGEKVKQFIKKTGSAVSKMLSRERLTTSQLRAL